MVEDDPADVYLIREVLKASRLNVTVQVAKNGERATDIFDTVDQNESANCPDLVILDINLPKKSGNEVLEHLRQSQRCRDALVVVVSTSDSETDRASFAKLDVDAYFPKPSEFDQFLKLGDIVRNLFPPQRIT